MKSTVTLIIIICLICTQAIQAQSNPLRKLPLDIRGSYALFLEDFELKKGVKKLTINAYLDTDEKLKGFEHHSITENHFDEEGQLILQRTVKPGTWDDENPPSRYYYKKSILDSVSGYTYNAKFHYNTPSQLQYIQFYTTTPEGEQEATVKQVYLYNAQDQLVAIKYYNGQMYSHRQYLLYDKAGNYYGYKLVDEDTDYYSSKKLADGSTETTLKSIDAKGNTKFYNRTLSRLDSSNKVLNIKIYDTHNKLTTQIKLIHQLNKNGDIIQTLTYTNGKLDRKEEKAIEYYHSSQHTQPYHISINDSLKKRSQPHEVLQHFLMALNQQDFKKAYSYCVGSRWGTADFFASEKSYGGITAVQIKSMGNADKSYANTAKIKTLTQVTDLINGSGEFEQLFTLALQKNEQWKITNIKLLASNRPQDNWNLQLTAQSWINDDAVAAYLANMYDTIPNDPQTESAEDTLTRTIQPLHFFKADNKEYALTVVANRGPFYGVATGHCDLFLFTKTDDNQWMLSDQLLEAGGGGMYGNPGKFVEMIRAGKHTAGIVIRGGQTHMGAYFHHDIISVKNGKLSKLMNIGVHHSYGNWEGHEGYKVCEDLSYKFLKDEKEMYDLQLTITNCLEGKKIAPKKITIPYKDGYVIPEAYIFSN